MTPKDTVTELLTLAGKQDAQAMAKLMSDDITIHLAGRSKLAGTHRGKDAFFSFFGSLVEMTDKTFAPKPHAIMGEGDHAVALLTISAAMDGRSHEWSQANVYHVADGLVTEIWLLPEDLYAFDEFWAG